MPELPEVESIVSELKMSLPEKRIIGIRLLRKGLVSGLSFSEIKERLLGAKINDVRRRGKWAIIELANGYSLLFHLRMTGRLIYQKEFHPRRYLRLVLRLDPDSFLLYQDLRRLGVMHILPADHLETVPPLSKLGAEPLSPDFTEERLKELLSSSRLTIRDFLMDQRWIAGIGNVYSAEILFSAALDPFKRANELTGREPARLHRAIIEVLISAITKKGTTISDYVTASGTPGEFQFELKVYNRENQPCIRCGSTVIRVKHRGRSLYFCPNCQR
jgi:formamidopyrimidine-DNA glycosylase